VGEYAQSVLARERLFEYQSRRYGTPVVLLRLNYAVELRYGVLVDLARKVSAREPIDVTMGHVNVIWQGDANSVALRSFSLCQSPPAVLNLTGPGTLSVRELAAELGRRLGVEPVFTGREADTALLNNASRCHALFGLPRVTLEEMLDGVAHWIATGGRLLDKPTHFEVRNGRF
jgi:nucleoside-diphosphate-sugar epimerase